LISEECLSIEWIKKSSAQNNNADKILVEKLVRALKLLEGLVEENLDFVFKGGTSLMLLLESTKRLSIDIDIVIESKVDLEKPFANIVKKKGFTRVELQERGKSSNLDKAHYKLYYKPAHKTAQEEEYILLDIVFQNLLYNRLVKIDIASQFVSQDGDAIKVTTPDIDNILGDKLTAFAPETTGIPYERSGRSMSMEIIKQLYDIGSIFDASTDFEATKKAFKRFAIEQLRDREINEDMNLVLDDIYDTALTICTRGKSGKARFAELEEGILKVNSFIFSENYHIEKAITDASKAAYLATAIKFDKNETKKYSDAKEVKDWAIEHPVNTRINKLKKSNPEAFFYWYKIYELESEEE
jgi:hypothetical protein